MGVNFLKKLVKNYAPCKSQFECSGAFQREWLALESPQHIVDTYIGPRTHACNGTPYSNGHRMFPTLYVHLIEKYVI